jgi:hypothetical protein
MFIATNRVCVQFKCRYHDANYYMLSKGSETPRELTVKDSGEMSLYFGDPIPEEWLVAFAEFKADEERKYQEWRERNAYLFAE